MPIEEQYPRVLIVLMNKVKAEDLVNVLIRAQFGDWPKDRLAQIHATGDRVGRGEFCGRYYRVQACDRFLGRLFQRLRGGVFEMIAIDAVEEQVDPGPPGRRKHRAKVVKKRLADWLIGSGLWELIFHVRLSKPMTRFVEAFKPDLIYCQGYSLGFATLPLLIARRFNIPICFQTTDDWPSSTYRRSPVGWVLRRRARELIEHSRVRLAFGVKMQEAYRRRYGVPFDATYHLDDIRRFACHVGAKPEPAVTILYVGALGHRRYEAIQDLRAAAVVLAKRLGSMRIKVLCHGIPTEMPRDLRSAKGVEFGPLPAHEDVPGVLARATVLFLPESFTVNPAAIEYSISTKAHFYMASRRPILVYGPSYSGVVGYAGSEGWGVVVDKRNRADLVAGLEKVLSDVGAVEACRQRAQECLRRNHSQQAGRARFLMQLSAAIRPENHVS